MTAHRDAKDSERLQVLVVESDVGIRRLLTDVLEPVGDVVAVSNAAEVPLLASFDVAIVDDRQDLDAVAIDVPLVIMTTGPSNLIDDQRFDLRRRGANRRVVEKPFSPHTLIELVRTVTEKMACFA